MQTDLRNRMQNYRQREGDRDTGVPVTLIRFGSWRNASQLIADVGTLPVAESTEEETPLQDADGNFYYLEGYSDPDGPDVVGP